MAFVAVYSWRVSDKEQFAAHWKRDRAAGSFEGWNFRLSVEDSSIGEAVFALHTRWPDERAWETALAARGTGNGKEDGAALLSEPMKKLVLEVYAVEMLHALTRPRLALQEQQPTKYFSVRVLEARGLPAKNANGFSDPYVVLKMPLQRKQQTSVKSQTLDPRWNESFSFSFGGENATRARLLKLSVRSKDFFFRTHEIGRASVDLRFYRDYSEPVWVPLVNPQGTKTKERGELLVQLILTADPAAATAAAIAGAAATVAGAAATGRKTTAPECRTWRELAPELQTGDLIFFESRGIPSKTIRWYTKSQYSHLGMVVLPKDIDESDVGNVILLAESHPNVRDRKDYRGKIIHGVQLCTVASKLELVSYKRVAVRKLVVARTPHMMQQLKEFLAEAKDLPYTSNFVEVIKAGGTGRFGVNESHLNSMHCTGLVAEIYIRWGLLPDNIASNNYSPFDIEALSLLRGYLTDDIVVFRSYNPITRFIDLEPASIQTRYTISRALKAFQGGKQYKPNKALRMLAKHGKSKTGNLQHPDEDAVAAKDQSQIAFEFETTEEKM